MMSQFDVARLMCGGEREGDGGHMHLYIQNIRGLEF